MKKILSLLMAVLVFFTSVPATAFAADTDQSVPQENYFISTNPYMTRLHSNINDEAEFELGFKVRFDGEEEDRFTAVMGENLLANGKIQIDNGKVWTFKEAGLKFANSESKSSYLTTSKDFIKDFYEKDSFDVTVITPEGYTIKTTEKVKNNLDSDERAAFKKSLGESEGQEGQTNQYTIDPQYTFIKNTYGTMVLRIDFKEFTSGSDPAKKAYLDQATININGIDFGSMKDLGFTITNYYGFELADLSKIKAVIEADDLNIVMTENGKTTSFTIHNGLTLEERQSISGTDPETKPQTEHNVIGTSNVCLVKTDDHSQESMAGATMKHEAEMITDADGNITMILHFAPANIMGILAYATGLDLEDGTTEFVLKEDNSGICVAKLPAFKGNEGVFAGHIHSSVMDADVDLKVEKPEKTEDLAQVLTKKVNEVEQMLEKGNFYENTVKPVETALENAKKSDDSILAYTELVKAVAGLREMTEDPFTGDTVFHVGVIDTSIVGSQSLEKYAKVEIVDGEKVMTVRYNSYLDWDGEVYMKNVKVFDKEGKEIPSEYKLDKYKTGTLSFVMPYVPASGIFDVTLTLGNTDELVETEIQMDLSNIVKGPFRQLLTDAIEKYGKYTADDWSTRVDMAEKKDDFTKASWDVFEKALQKAEEDLKSPVLTQDQIEKDIEALKEARMGLVYKIQAGSGKTANTGINGLNNPSAPYYDDAEKEYPEYVGWGGSKVIYGNDGEVFRVLDTGKNEDGNTGRILLMSENLRVKKPFTTDEDDTAVRWDTSEMRKYMNDEFYNQSFSDIEKSAIVKSKVETFDYTDGYMGPPAAVPDSKFVTEDYIFAPGMSIVTNEKYGFGSKDSRIVATEYSLREKFTDLFGEVVTLGVSPKGRIAGTYLLSSSGLNSPVCMNIDSSKILMTIDANREIPEKVTAAEDIDTNLWKFVMQDDSMKLEDQYNAVVDGNKVSIDLKDNTEKILAVVVEGDDFTTGNVKAYGIVDPKQFELPGFDMTKDKLYIMSIRDEEGKTAYASIPAKVNITKDIKPEEPEKPDTTVKNVKIAMRQNGKDTLSMCDPLFAEKADVEAYGDDILLKLYVAYPVPAFPEDGTDGTLKDFVVTYNGREYKAKSDITSKPLMTVKADNPIFGLVKGEQIQAQVISVVLPREAFSREYLDVQCFVNVFMNSTVDFDMVLSDVDLPEKPVEPETKPEPEKPVEPETKPEPEKPSEPETKPEVEKPAEPGTKPGQASNEKLDYRNLKDGVYMVQGVVLKTDKKTPSMADKAVNHNIKLTVKGGKYYLTLDFQGMKMGQELGYLGDLKYFLSGYSIDANGNPVGKLGNVKVEKYQYDKDGKAYPDIVTFEMIPEALNNGLVPMQVFVPIMESIAPGTGTQPVFLKLNWNTIKSTSVNDPLFNSNNTLGSVVRTGDTNSNMMMLWVSVMLLGCVIAFAGYTESKKMQR